MSQLCVVGGYTYPYNPHTIKDVPQQSITEQATLGGGYVLDYGNFVFDQIIEHKWHELEQTFFNQLLTLRQTSAQLTLVNHLGATYTVAVIDLTHDGIIEGTDSMVNNVVVKYKRLA